MSQLYYSIINQYIKLYKLQDDKKEKLSKMKEQYERIKDLDEKNKYTFQPILESNMYYIM